jgi:hypothetical protein
MGQSFFAVGTCERYASCFGNADPCSCKGSQSNESRQVKKNILVGVAGDRNSRRAIGFAAEINVANAALTSRVGEQPRGATSPMTRSGTVSSRSLSALNFGSARKASASENSMSRSGSLSKARQSPIEARRSLGIVGGIHP